MLIPLNCLYHTQTEQFCRAPSPPLVRDVTLVKLSVLALHTYRDITTGKYPLKHHLLTFREVKAGQAGCMNIKKESFRHAGPGSFLKSCSVKHKAKMICQPSIKCPIKRFLFDAVYQPLYLKEKRETILVLMISATFRTQ